MSFVKVNYRRIPIKYRRHVSDYGETDFEPCFMFEHNWHWMKDFIRCHDNPWVSDVYPKHIHGMENDGLFPLFIELIGDEYVNVYREEED